MKKGRDLFNVAMWTYYDAEVFELVRTSLSEKIGEVNKNQIELYRVNGLSILRKESGIQFKKIAKIM